ncbi:molecular chaperone [Synechococcus sp. PCC 7502]|uniref:Hsp70 family protein n=1 Tax=Synechococcus sp. PCC 7502 TaxID=1173263 RepID=UPI00029F9F9E|nr:Hsp70 family protein [Synechococcus sp. PCC 7502]AFY73845.1 molecular chaperone [Synechococcus sp. PCC 7502]
MHYAIDFGTSNTVIARINNNGEIETLKLEQFSQFQPHNPPVIPSLVFVENAASSEVVVGQSVRDRGLDFRNHNQRFFQNFKRAIAQPLSGFLPELDGIEITSAMIGRWFLTELIRQLPEVTSLVVTVPVDSFESYRQWLSGVCEDLAVSQVSILDEPTAAALGYGLNTGNETILVIDMGGGTLDMSLVKLNLHIQNQIENQDQIQARKQTLGFLLKWGDRILNQSVNQSVNPSTNQVPKPTIARVIAKTGQNLGGIDIDNWLVGYFCDSLGLPHNSVVARLAEKLKITLSTSEQATEVFFDDETFNSYSLELGRSQFDNILQAHNFFNRLDQSLDQIKQQALRQGLDLASIDAVLLVGGTAQIPAVHNWIKQYFPPQKIKSHKPFEAIAHGALNQNFQLQDFLYHSYGVRYWDKRYRQHNWHPIIKSGAAYPTEPIELVLGASQLDQPSIELVIGELGETSLEVYFEGDRLITRLLKQSQTVAQKLNEQVITPLDPLGQPGSDRLKVSFQVNAQRTLCISIEDLLTKQLILQNQPVVKLV